MAGQKKISHPSKPTQKFPSEPPDIPDAAPRAEKTEAQIAQEEAYVAINKAMRNADSLATLGEVWKLKQADIRTLPANWQQELAEEKDRLKVQLAQGAPD